ERAGVDEIVRADPEPQRHDVECFASLDAIQPARLARNREHLARYEQVRIEQSRGALNAVDGDAEIGGYAAQGVAAPNVVRGKRRVSRENRSVGTDVVGQRSAWGDVRRRRWDSGAGDGCRCRGHTLVGCRRWTG